MMYRRFAAMACGTMTSLATVVTGSVYGQTAPAHSPGERPDPSAATAPVDRSTASGTGMANHLAMGAEVQF
ncbi:hypothetical protein LVJ94_03415 [Pendulispora rubella]|uniref:Uncharacterized protein n=1 Tax=Pendulispora rubella TaxID=2741070 RepID=A0ABZ2L5S8_9BACT